MPDYKRGSVQTKYRNRNAGKKIVTKNRSKSALAYDLNPASLRRKQEYAKGYNQRTKKTRAIQNGARQSMIKSGRVKVGESNKTVQHKTPVSKGGGNDPKNLSIMSMSKNSALKNKY